MRGDLLIAPRGQSYVNPTLLSEEAGPAFAAWGHNKAVFFRKPGASGEISITGRRLDAAGVVKFVSGGATRVSDAFVLHAGEGSNVTGMLIPASGCYELSVTAGGRRATLVFDTTLCSATPLGTTPAAGAIPPCSR